jgi:chorismate dehydratase
MQENSLLRIGKIRYLNMYPVFCVLEKSMRGQSYEIIPGVPSWLNQMVRSGAVDVSPSSSIEYLRNPDRYTLLDNHSVSSTGPVGSIILFSRVPVHDLHGASVLTSTQSETSVVLLDVLLKKFLKLNCSLVPSSEPLAHGLDHGNQACLLIGDDALHAAKRNSDLYHYDLGQMWHEFTCLPFVYALWICNTEVCAHKEEALKRFQKELNMAKNYIKNNLIEIADCLGTHPFLTLEEIVSFWQGISYDLTETHKKGLELFRKFAQELGHI